MPTETTGRVVLLLEERATKTNLTKVQRELGVKMTSSEALGDDLSAQEVYDSGSGLVFKNLQVAVVDAPEDEPLDRLARGDSAIIAWERERIYRPVSHQELLDELRQTLELAQEQLAALELTLRAPEPPAPARMTWGLRSVGFSPGRCTGKGIRVAVLDTGISGDHPDFGELEIKGKSFIPDQAWDADGSGHGTHCAGVIVGTVSRENGIHFGIAPEVELLVGKVLANDGNGTSGTVIDGIDWAVEKGARVISLSLGTPVAVGEKPSPIFERIGRRALAKNCLIIAAAGNDSRRPRQMPRPVSNPANAESIMSVAALDRNLRVAPFSNAGLNVRDGGRVDLAAPGVDIYSTYSDTAHNGGRYAGLSGTSMATPHVAAIAATYCEKYPRLKASEIWLKLEKAARRLDDQKYRDVGQGLVQLPAE